MKSPVQSSRFKVSKQIVTGLSLRGHRSLSEGGRPVLNNRQLIAAYSIIKKGNLCKEHYE
jgi:hypothetical protein